MDIMAALIALLMPVLASVESGNNPNAVGDGGKAVGIYQIHPGYVQDVNRIARTAYTLDDRKDPVKAAEMVTIYLTHYGERYVRITGNEINLEALARMHNGGPNGWKMQATESYWKKCGTLLVMEWAEK